MSEACTPNPVRLARTMDAGYMVVVDTRRQTAQRNGIDSPMARYGSRIQGLSRGIGD